MNVYAFKWVEANSRDRGMEEHTGFGDGLDRKTALPKIKKQLRISCVLELLGSWLYCLILFVISSIGFFLHLKENLPIASKLTNA